MTDITKLKVSLTKHGAHKIAQLLVKYGADALEHTHDEGLAIDINSVQASKTLSAYDGDIPSYWEGIIKLGQNTINAAVMVSIIFSHHELIEAMADSCGESQIGAVTDASFASRKGFTNFKNDVDELGFSLKSSSDEVVYNFSKIVSNAELGSYVKLILADKLKQAGQDNHSDLLTEAIALGFNRVFGLSEDSLKAWLSGSSHSKSDPSGDEEFQSESVSDFVFRSGHNPRLAIRAAFRKPSESPESQLLHNFLQTRLYEQLLAEYTKDQIGTEVPVGIGKACVDVCLVIDQGRKVFYEIKTQSSVRANVVGC